MADPCRGGCRQRRHHRAVAAMHKGRAGIPRGAGRGQRPQPALLAITEEIENGSASRAGHWCAVGFCQCSESKERLFATCGQYGVPAIVAMGRKGGNVAAAICNALLYQAAEMLDPMPAAGSKKQRGGDTVMYVDWDYYKIFYYVAKHQKLYQGCPRAGSNQPNITHTMNVGRPAALRAVHPLHRLTLDAGGRELALRPHLLRQAAVQIQDAEEELSASASLFFPTARSASALPRPR